VKDTRSCDVQHGAKGRRTTKADGSTNITPALNYCPTLDQELLTQDRYDDDAPGGADINTPVG
jgi:hypothetical protein